MIFRQRITRKDQVDAALDALLTSKGPWLLHVAIDEHENVWPLVPPGASNANMMENRMNQHQLSIEARFRPEVLERILRVVRHRGFQVCAMNMAAVANAENINIEMTVASLRSVDLLSTQLSKLMDVACVQIQQQTTQQIRA